MTEASYENEVRSLEECLLRADVRESSERLGELLARDFVEFGSSGRIFNREEAIAAVQAGPSEQLQLADFKAKILAPGLVLATYTSTRVSSTGQQVSALRSSLWRFREGRWQVIFHQGTPVPDSRSKRAPNPVVRAGG